MNIILYLASSFKSLAATILVTLDSLIAHRLNAFSRLSSLAVRPDVLPDVSFLSLFIYTTGMQHTLK
jgi:hypothetical protein